MPPVQEEQVVAEQVVAEPVFVFAPFVASPVRVEPGWIDYNGHMNMAYYHVLFDRAVDEAFEVVGLGPDYLASRNASYFTAELHTTYLRELPAEAVTRTTVRIVDFDEKRVHAYFEAHQLEEGWVAATCEQLFLHVDMTTRRVAPFPEDILARLEAVKAVHDRLPRPQALGRSVGIKAGRVGAAG
ncbi:thioesterase family protein [Enterovirga aerilata]|uniref:Thioesterase n=1 Tax=Enterovirga aerilata TaxID=2730920 RepID=A0A849HWM2_9HYPH|nr:thioesterase [Enterovirga sp. DB1703]